MENTTYEQIAEAYINKHGQYTDKNSRLHIRAFAFWMDTAVTEKKLSEVQADAVYLAERGQ